MKKKKIPFYNLGGLSPLETKQSPGVISNNPNIVLPTVPQSLMPVNTQQPKYQDINQKGPNDEDLTDKQKGKIGVSNAASLMGGLLTPTLGILSMMNKSNNERNLNYINDYHAYQNDMQNSVQGVDRGSVLNMMKYGGRINKFNKGGQLPMDMSGGPAQVQTEKGETIVNSFGNIFDVKANKEHKDMKKDEATDILLPDQYVLSNKLFISKKTADKVSMGINPLVYKEHGDKSTIKEKFLSDLFKKDKHSVAEISKILRDKFPTADEHQEKNIFANLASDLNKETRMTYLNELIQANEMKKQSKQSTDKYVWGGNTTGNPIGIATQMALNMYNSNNSVLSNLVDPVKMTPDNVLTGTKPSVLDISVPNVTSNLFNRKPVPAQVTSVPKTPSQYDLIKSQLDSNLEAQNQFDERNLKSMTGLNLANQVGNLAGAGIGLMGVYGQNPLVEAPRVARVNTPRSVGRSYYDYLGWNNNKSMRSLAGAALENTTDYGRAMSYLGNNLGQIISGNNQSAAAFAQQNLGLETQYQQNLANTRSQQSQFDISAKNQTVANLNNKLASSANIGVNAVNQSMGLTNSHFNYANRLRTDRMGRQNMHYNNLLQLELLKKYLG